MSTRRVLFDDFSEPDRHACPHHGFVCTMNPEKTKWTCTQCKRSWPILMDPHE